MMTEIDLNDADAKKKFKYPVSVFFIIVNEFCERFSYYGMKTVLGLYFRDILLYDESESTVYYHLFSMLCYFTPVFGAILADTYLGKFKTILYLSILYACGNIMLSVASIPNTLPQKEFSLLGLFIIGVGTGGIKPCVSAFGGEQFVRPQQDKQLEQFFSYFYISINAGSLLSTLLTPILREDIQCFGQSSCFPLAFGVPAILMIVAIVVFFFGKWNYKMRPTEGNIMVDVSKCIAHAIGRKFRSTDEKHDHWLYFASDKFDMELIKDIKQVLHVLVLYLPIPVFWALYDQQGSRWLFQATRMDGSLGFMSVKPDQIGIVNPLLIIAITPLFNSLIYPCFKKCGLLTPLQRIGTGGLLIGISFVISGIVELNLETTYPRIPAPGLTQLNFINTLPCPVNISYAHGNHPDKWLDVGAKSFSFERDLMDGPIRVKANLLSPRCQDVTFSNAEWTGTIEGVSTKAFSVVVTVRNGKLEVARMKTEEPLDKANSGHPRVGFIFNLNNDSYDQGNITLKSSSKIFHLPFIASNFSSTLDRLVSTDTIEVDVGTYKVFIPRKDGGVNTDDEAGSITVLQGGCYTIVVQRSLNPLSGENEDGLVMPIEVTPYNSIHMMWLLPQYFIITAGEVMFSVTGLQFSFTQAPERMQSVMQAAWLLNVAFGNLIVTVVAKAKLIPRQSMEFFLFAGLIALDIILFVILALRYTYVEDEKEKSESMKRLRSSTVKEGTDNKAFTSETAI
ncbi:solute carrier family 15 member 1-like [Daphnia pulex]|uniref:solute carrier family 15 member 1-like n=1 Tax=Daphnia pulex TaxID=6669 RepID=UPI001EE04AD1|nr:solute carrier family 15 member 1-like [Daphnia pulex]